MSSKHCNKQTVFSEMWSFYWYLTFVTWQVSLVDWLFVLPVGGVAVCWCVGHETRMHLPDEHLIGGSTAPNTNRYNPTAPASSGTCLFVFLTSCCLVPTTSSSAVQLHSPPLLSSPLLSSPLSPIDPISLIVLIESQRRALLWFHY